MVAHAGVEAEAWPVQQSRRRNGGRSERGGGAADGKGRERERERGWAWSDGGRVEMMMGRKLGEVRRGRLAWSGFSLQWLVSPREDGGFGFGNAQMRQGN
jgi:hypothetical protein